MSTESAGGPPVSVARLASQPTTRRRAAVAATTPGSTMRRASRRASSQGHPAAHSCCAVPTREYQSGGRPTHSAATRRAHPNTRAPPSRPAVAFTLPHRSSRSTSYVLAALRALHVDPSHAARSKATTTAAPDENAAHDLLDRPFHISTATANVRPTDRARPRRVVPSGPLGTRR